jgi:hypothetical protein
VPRPHWTINVRFGLSAAPFDFRQQSFQGLFIQVMNAPRQQVGQLRLFLRDSTPGPQSLIFTPKEVIGCLPSRQREGYPYFFFFNSR